MIYVVVIQYFTDALIEGGADGRQPIREEYGVGKGIGEHGVKFYNVFCWLIKSS